jgi:hypothetical protein
MEIFIVTVCGNVVHWLSLLIVTIVTHGLLWDVVCFYFATLTMCQLFPFFWSITDVEAILIVCVPVASSYSDHRVCSSLSLAFHARAGDGDASLASP